MKKNSGVTITMLVIEIVVMIILAGSAIKITADLNNESKLTTFANDLQTVEDSSMSYYAKNSELPKTDDAGIEKSALVAKVTDTTISGKLSTDITANGDDSDTFYIVDLSKIAVKTTARGNGDNGVADYYYIASNSKRVYYPKGVKVSGEYYFSLNSELTSKTDVTSNVTEDTTSITISNTTASIKITKNTTKYSNTINVSVDTECSTGETLKYYIANTEITPTNTTVSGDITTFDIIPSYITGNAQIETDFTTDANKVFKVEKIKDGNVVATASTGIKNMDIYAPTFDTNTQSAVINSYDSFNTLSFSSTNAAVDAGGSGIKEIRYEYLEKNTINGVVNYYENQTPIASMTTSYMLTYGKKSDKEIIKLPKYIKTIAVSWVDNAGNVSSPIAFSITDASMLGVE